MAFFFLAETPFKNLPRTIKIHFTHRALFAIGIPVKRVFYQLERFKALEEFDAENEEAHTKLIDAMIIKNEVEGAMNPFAKR